MRIEKLKCLVDIAQTGSITSTAQRLFITQQAVSKSIKYLEQEIGAELLVRTTQGVYLTEAGQMVVAAAERILAEEEKMYRELSYLNDKDKEKKIHIEISSSSPVTNLVLPDIIAKLIVTEKNISFNIIPAYSIDSVLDRVLNQANQIGLMTINEQEFTRRYHEVQEKLERRILLRDEFVMVADKRFYAGNNLEISEKMYLDAPIKTLYSVIPIDSMKEEVYTHNIICSNDADFHRSMMEKTGAITIMPRLAYQYYFDQKRYLALRPKYVSDTVIHVAVYHKDIDVQAKNLVSMISRKFTS